MVKVGHARLDENNKVRGGEAGDQTSKEVVIQNWYNKGWSAVFRAKDSKAAEKIAKTMEAVCNNNNIGYNQGKRLTLYENAKKHNWDVSKIAEKCECDCSSLVAVCVNAAGINVNKDMYTGNQKAILLATGKFNVLTDSKYLTNPDYLKRGDILLTAGHTAIVLSEHIYDRVDTAKSFDRNLAGKYKVSASKLNIRQGAGTTKNIITSAPKGAIVQCYGYYTKTANTKWLYIQFNHNNKIYTGFVSSKYLIK